MQDDIHDNAIQRNAAIELHDSELTALCRETSALVLDLRACVHRSHGTPGTDPGTVWIQPASIILPNGRLLGPKPELPCTIIDGDMTTSHRTYDNMIPCPLASQYETTVNLTLSSGQRTQIEADQLTIAFTGDPEFIEDFDGF